MCEILAPAGDKNSALAAINSGADAIYLGLKSFSARSSAENFDFENLEDICGYAHSFGVKIYVAMNTLVKDSEAEDFIRSALKAWNCGADAIIISDVFLGKFIKEAYPDIVLHLSTQAGVCNVYGAYLAKEFGFDRVILSRETSFDDIKSIAKIIETEIFVQGALCTCFSGQCYLSSFAGGNSGNRGRCKQPCRKRYSVDRKGFEGSDYKISLSDLSMGEDIKKLKDIGVFSFKIEGRMRRSEYVAAAVKYYKNILSGEQNGGDLSDLKRTFNRGNYTKGICFGQDKSLISSAVQGHIGEYVGTVKVENGKFTVKSPQKFAAGDCFKILREGKEVGGAESLCEVKGGFVLKSRERLKNGDKAFITTDTALNARLSATNKLIPVEISARFFAGKQAEICINGHKFYGEKPLESAKNRPLESEDIKNCFKKTDKYPFDVTFGKIETDCVFVAASELNSLRRNIFAEFYASLSANKNKILTKNHAIPHVKVENNGKIAVICSDLNGVSADIGILKPKIYDKTCSMYIGNFSGEKYLFLPPYLSGAEIEIIKPLLENFDGIYCDGIYGFKLSEQLKKPLFAGTGINISNAVGAGCNAKYFAISKELTVSEAKNLGAKNAFYLSAGGVKVMDLIYCPFEKKCSSCDRREIYTLTDEDGRRFPLRRYKIGDKCRFEIYNCVNLVGENAAFGALIDCTLEENAQNLVKIFGNSKKTVEYFGGKFTRGHSVKPIE